MNIPIKIAPKLLNKDTSGVEQNEKYIIFLLVAICVCLYYFSYHFLNKKIKNLTLVKLLSGSICIVIFFILLSIFIL